MEAAMDLMRRISPNHSEAALSALLTLLPHHSSDLLSQVDHPVQSSQGQNQRGLEDGYPKKFINNPFKGGNLEFILCEYNRDADSYRSPWSNKYYAPLGDAPLPSDDLRKLEVEANDIFAIYCDQYYEGGISSVYMWEDGNEGFVACFLIKKDGSKSAHGRRGFLEEGAWDAIHVIEMNLDLSLVDGHLCNMGRMIEEMESKLRNSLDQVYFGKTEEMVCTLLPPLEIVQPRMPDC